MRIESIQINNFRQYQHFVLDFPKTQPGGNDLHIILGSNGVGKTNILNAITWCLYNEELHLGDKNTAVERINYTEVERLRKENKSSGEVSVTIKLSTDDDKETAIFERKQKYTIKENSVFELPSNLIVKSWSKQGYKIIEEQEATSYLVNKYVPKSINEYIFFDGEHLEHYFQEGEKDNIKNGINKLTQTDIIESAVQAYYRFIKKELEPQLSNAEDNEVATIQEELDTITTNIENQIQLIEDTKKQIEQCDRKNKEFKELIKDNETLPDKLRELEELEQTLSKIEKEKKEKMKELYSFTREYYQYLALYTSTNKFYKYIKEQEKEGKLPPRIDKNLVLEILKTHKCAICDRELDSNSYAAVEKLQKQLDVSSEVSAKLNRSMSVMENFHTKCREYRSKKELIFKDLKNIEERYQLNEKRFSVLKQYISTIPHPKVISEAIKNYENYKRKSVDLNQNIGKYNFLLEMYRTQKTDTEKRLKQATQKNSKLNTIRQKKDYCQTCQNILREIKNEILLECRTEMESMTFEIFSNLIWKKDMFKSVKISEEFDFKLINKYGQQSLGSCSAAERALLALSFTLALQHSSNHDSLIFIDTPIGRVDEDNRSNFINTLLEIAKKKQVILTFTPTEYDENVRQLLNDKYNTFCTLQMNNSATTKTNNNEESI